MIDPFSGMAVVAAWLGGTSVYALNGWHRAVKSADTARDSIAHYKQKTAVAERAAREMAAAVEIAEAERNAAETARRSLIEAYYDAENKLRKIEHQRHVGAKKARAAQLEQQRAKKAATTDKLRQELTDSIALEPALAA